MYIQSAVFEKRKKYLLIKLQQIFLSFIEESLRIGPKLHDVNLLFMLGLNLDSLLQCLHNRGFTAQAYKKKVRVALASPKNNMPTKMNVSLHFSYLLDHPSAPGPNLNICQTFTTIAEYAG